MKLGDPWQLAYYTLTRLPGWDWRSSHVRLDAAFGLGLIGFFVVGILGSATHLMMGGPSQLVPRSVGEGVLLLLACVLPNAYLANRRGPQEDFKRRFEAQSLTRRRIAMSAVIVTSIAIFFAGWTLAAAVGRKHIKERAAALGVHSALGSDR